MNQRFEMIEASIFLQELFSHVSSVYSLSCHPIDQQAIEDLLARQIEDLRALPYLGPNDDVALVIKFFYEALSKIILHLGALLLGT